MSRAVTRAATAGFAGLVTVVLAASPALADNPIGPSEGAEPGEALSTAASLFLYVGAPLLAAVVIGLAVMLPGSVRSHRYRPAEGWTAPPVWFAGPVDGDSAVAAAAAGPDDMVRGGARGNW